jgi:hypothetical protein
MTAAMADWQQLAREAEAFSPQDQRRTLALHNLGALNVELGNPLEAIGYLEDDMATGAGTGGVLA